MPGFDFKKEYKNLYLPPSTPALIQVPDMQFIMVNGKGDPNEPDGAYQQSVGLLYALSFTIKMSLKSGTEIDGYFPYMVPPLEGLWQLSGAGTDYSRKQDFEFISMIRQPDFVTQDVFNWACAKVRKKKPDLDPDLARLETYAEGLCVQMMHRGPYDAEPETLSAMKVFMEQEGLTSDISAARRHHEIYLGDPRRTKPENLKTVLRCPVKRLEE